MDKMFSSYKSESDWLLNFPLQLHCCCSGRAETSFIANANTRESTCSVSEWKLSHMIDISWTGSKKSRLCCSTGLITRLNHTLCVYILYLYFFFPLCQEETIISRQLGQRQWEVVWRWPCFVLKQSNISSVNAEGTPASQLHSGSHICQRLCPSSLWGSVRGEKEEEMGK